jgi:energy-coupling factor transport system permease protein
MKALVKLLLLVIYTFSVFFIKSPYFLCGFALCNALLMLFFKINALRALRELALMLPFIIFAALINLFFGGIGEMIQVGARLVLVCNITFIFRRLSSSMELARAVELLFYPLNLFQKSRGASKDIGLMVCIAVAFIPVLQRELEEIIRALASKGMKLSPKTMRYLLKPFLTGILKRSGEVALALKAKGYE